MSGEITYTLFDVYEHDHSSGERVKLAGVWTWITADSLAKETTKAAREAGRRVTAKIERRTFRIVG